MKNRLFAILVIAFVIFTASCSSETPEIVPEYTVGNEKTDFDGYNFRILRNISDESILGYTQDTLFADALKQHMSKIEKATNSTISIQSYGTDFFTPIQARIAGGIDFADIFYGGAGNGQMTLALGGAFVAFDDYADCIDVHNTEKFGPPNILECAMVGGKYYGILPALWPNKIMDGGNFGEFFTFNNDIIRRYGMPDPREIDENGEWTTENFTKITPQYYVEDGDVKIYSFVANTKSFGNGFLGAIGLKYVVKSGSKWVSSINSPKVIDILTWANDYAAQNSDYILFQGDWTSHEYFIRNECTLALTQTLFINDIAAGVDSFGLLPFPAGKDIKRGDQLTYFSTTATFSIPVTTPEPEATARILDLLCEPLEGYETEDSRSELLFKTMFFDQRDVEYYSNIYKTAVYRYMAVGATTISEELAGSFYSKSPAQVVESLEERFDPIIEKYIAPNYEAIYG